ncbi:hypothetical protein Q9189_001717 [Teloschistes chrysophthalmus]
MNTRHAIDESTGPISLAVSFNQDSSCFAVGLDTGFCVFNSDPCELKVSREFNAGIGAAEMLGRANYVALVGGGRNPKFPTNKVGKPPAITHKTQHPDPTHETLTRSNQKKVIIWDDAKQLAVVTLEFQSQVLRALLSRSQILVAVLNSISLYAFSSPPQKISSYETADNPLGLCCLGSKIVAFPGRTPGQVQIVEIGTGNVSIIPAHGTPLRAMCLSPNGEILATASETGTLVRIFSTSNYTYSFASAPIAIDDDPHSALSGAPAKPAVPIPGLRGGRARKGVVGWLDDWTVLVVGAGRDGRWEKFVLGDGEMGKKKNDFFFFLSLKGVPRED